MQGKFSSRSRAWTDVTADDTATSRVKLRVDHRAKLPSSKSITEVNFADKDYIGKLFEDFVDVQVNDLNLELSMSTVTGLADLVEDEVVPVPIPMQVIIYARVF